MPEVVELKDIPLNEFDEGRRIPAPWGLWRRLCDATPPGKALEVTDLIPDGMTAREFRGAYARGAWRYGCRLQSASDRAFLTRR